jgi:acetyl esterase/lipase
MRIKIKFFFLFLIINYACFSQVRDTIYLWPDQANDKSSPVTLPGKGDNVTRITNIVNPALIVFKPGISHKTGAAAIVSPGGAFRHLSIDKEGFEVAEWLNSMGITAFVLQYSVPEKRDQAVHDLKRAIRVVRSRASEWGIDPEKLGVIGFSAGGNLSARVSEIPEKADYNHVDSKDSVSCIPDFAILIYPGGMGNAKEKPSDLQFGKGTPPMFIFCTADDGVANFGSLYLTEELYHSGVPVELHVLPEGGHGYGLRPANVAARTWPPLAEKWLYKYVLN